MLRLPRASEKISIRNAASQPFIERRIPSADSANSSSNVITGRAQIIDGDTIDIVGTRIRLFGIDAPEGGQSCRDEAGKPWLCGSVAALKLADFVQSKLIECEPRDRDRYGRVVAICRAGADDLGSWLVRQGLALDWPRYSKGRYADEQQEALAVKRGLWSGSFVPPWDWRKCVRAGGRNEQCSQSATSATKN